MVWKDQHCNGDRSQPLLMQDPDRAESYLRAADTKPSLLLEGAVPRLLDEWQTAPQLWDAVRHTVDIRGKPGQFILTGSAVPHDHAVKHSGTGRISRLRMRTMSLYESKHSNGTVSLKALFDGKQNVEGASTLSIEQLAECVIRGGWPASVDVSLEVASRHAIDYVEAVIQEDISRVDGVEKNPFRVRTLLRSLARNLSTTASLQTIFCDIASSDNDISLSDKTISQYLTALERLYVIDNIPAWNPILRSKTSIRTTPKRQFVDPSVAAAVLRLTPQKILDDFKTFGFFFESLCARDLRIYAGANDGEVFHYRDSYGLEADAVVSLHDGRWGAVEVKLGSREIEEAAAHLLKLKNTVNASKMLEPSFLMVLTGTELAYRRKDGVLIVPVGCLKD